MAVPGGYRAGGQLVVATLLATAVASCGASKPAGSPTAATSVNAPLVSRTTSPPHGAASSVVSFFIPSEAMAPTLRDGDHIAVEEIYAASAIHRGVIVVFKEPPNDIEPGMTDLVKRIIGLPGETIASRDGSVYQRRCTERAVATRRGHHIGLLPGPDSAAGLLRDWRQPRELGRLPHLWTDRR